MSKPPPRAKTVWNSTAARARESTVSSVFFRFRPRFAAAMPKGVPPPLTCRFFFRRPLAPSVYRTASTGDTLPASLPGLLQERNTVNSVNKVAKTNIRPSALISEILP